MKPSAKHFEELSPEERRALLPHVLQKKIEQLNLALQDKCIHQLFEAQAKTQPGAVAIISDNVRLTYGELNARANRLAHYLRAQGVMPDSLVGLYMKSSLESVVAILAILKAGGAYLPLDTSSPPKRLASMLKDSQLAMLISREQLPDTPAEHQARVVYIDSDAETIARYSDADPVNNTALSNLACAHYSGRRVVLVEHRGLCHRLSWFQRAFSLTTSDVVLQHSPLFQSASTWEILWPLVYGGRLAITASDAEQGPAHLTRFIAEQRVSIAHFVPSELSLFLDALDEHSPSQLSSLRLTLCSGEPLPQAIVEKYFQYFPRGLHYLYAIAEAGGEVTSHACRPGDARVFMPIGKASNSSLYLLDKNMQPVPIGATGEIYVGGAGLARGYLHATAETAMRFVENPFSNLPGERLFRTGERARRLRDGSFELVGSKERHAWIGGNRIEPEEIEAALIKEASCEECVVIARETERGFRQLVAYIVASGQFSPERLETHLQSLLPAYMHPSAYVPVTSLPLTADGEVDEQALARLQVIDADLLRRWEERLRSRPEIKEVAVIAQDHTESLPPLHLSDLLPEWKAAATDAADKPEIITARSDAAREETKSKPLAVSHGEALPHEPGAPTVLSQALQRAARSEPQKGMVYIQADGTEIAQSYAALLEEAYRILAGLRQMGLKPQDKVIFQLDLNQDFIPAFWGCVLGGFVPVPISVPTSYDQTNSAVNKLHNAWLMLNRPPILTSAKLAPAVRSLWSLLESATFEVAAIDDLRSCGVDRDAHPCQPDDLAILLLTSGSTGLPKAVMQSHRSLLSRSAATALRNGFTQADVSLNWFPLDHVGGIVMFHVRDVYLCSQQVHVPTESILQSPLKWLDYIERYRVTLTWAPNFAYGLVNAQAEELAIRRWDLSSLRFILNAGEAIVAKTARRFMELLIPHGLPATAMHPAWGMSETSSAVTFSNNFLLDSTSDSDSFVVVGKPIPGFSMRIVDAEDRPVEEGTTGRLQVTGLSVTSGYFQNPKVNQESFTADGWLKTGDLGVLKDGALTITGREKDVIIINGVNYYSHEIESVVEEDKGVEVSYTAAVAVREPNIDTDKVAVFFSPARSHEADIVSLIKQLRSRIVQNIGINPDYLLPVERDVIPKTAIGKIQRTQLKNRFEAGEFDSILKQLDILSGNANTVPDWFYRKVWQPKETRNLAPLTTSGLSLIFLDRTGLGKALGSELERRNHRCVYVEGGDDFLKVSDEHYQINPQDSAQYRRLLASLAEANLPVRQILHLWTYDETVRADTSLDSLERAQEIGMYSLLSLVQALAQLQGIEHPANLLVVSSYAQFTSPADEIACGNSPLLGLIKAMPQELPWLSCRHVDLAVDGLESNAARVLREMNVTGTDREVAYRDGRRLVPRLEKVDLKHVETQALPFKPGGTYLISGGLGGIGVELSRYLLNTYGARLLLVGRTPLRGEDGGQSGKDQSDKIAERAQALRMLQQLDGEVVYERVDICDFNQLKHVTEKMKSSRGWELDGVIHLAGILQERMLLDETRESIEGVLRPKLLGTWALHQLVNQRPGSLFISFSSVNSFFGGAMIGAYAAANSFVESFAHYQRYKCSMQSYCFSWSMWDEVGMSRDYPKKELSRARGYYSISVREGLNSLLAGLYHNQQSLLIGLNGANRHLRSHVKAKSYQAQKLCAYFTGGTDPSPLPGLEDSTVKDRFGVSGDCQFFRLEEMPHTAGGDVDLGLLSEQANRTSQSASSYVAARTNTERAIAAIWKEVLSVERVGIHDNFFDLGGSSLRMAQVLAQLRTTLEQQLAMTDLFQHPTVASLASHLDSAKREQPTLQLSYDRAELRKAARTQRRGNRSHT
jgi:amino acid adenylation domain-containing protein